MSDPTEDHITDPETIELLRRFIRENDGNERAAALKFGVDDCKQLLDVLEGYTGSVLQPWVMKLPLRAQGTLLTGIRNCDLIAKAAPGHGTHHDEAARQLVALLRFCVLVPADEREVDVEGAWFQSRPPRHWKPSLFGHLPQHWYSHLMHCFEVVGYLHPDPKLSRLSTDIYEKLVDNLHLSCETKEQMMKRLTEDRIANGTVVS